MRAVHSCDFCGDDAVGTYEVVPDDLAARTDQRRVALCSHCYDTLDTVLEPFLDGTAASAEDDGHAVAAEEPGDGDTVGGVDDAAEESSDDADEPATSAAVDADARAEGIAIGRSEDDESDDPLATSDAILNGQSAAEEPAEADGSASDETEAAETPTEPDQFRKVMRLLNNRQFPIDRAEFAELASGAYELGDDHVADIIDYADERGVVVDDDGTLRKN